MTPLLREQLTDFIRHLLSATANGSLYGMNHPQVQRFVSQAYHSLSAPLEESGGVTLMVIDNELIVEGEPQPASLFTARLVQLLLARGIRHIRVEAGIILEELEALVAALSSRSETGEPVVSTAHLVLGGVEVRRVNGGSGGERRRIELPEMPARERERFMEIYESVKKGRQLKMAGIGEIVTGFMEVFRQEGKALMVMAALRETDEYTFTHSTNVCILNMAQAMALGIEGQLLNDIGISAMLHDIGKLFVPEEIICKTGALTPAEQEIMRQHPVRGARYLLEAPGVPRLAVSTAYEHHMKYDFGGYPKVPAGWRQNLCSQMTNISDVFDALRTRRSYKEPLELRQIAEIMLNLSGKDLHPGLTRNFLRIISRMMKETSDLPEMAV